MTELTPERLLEDRAELMAEVQRLRATLAAKEESQRANEDEMSAEIARLRVELKAQAHLFAKQGDRQMGLEVEIERLRKGLDLVVWRGMYTRDDPETKLAKVLELAKAALEGEGHADE